MSEAIRTTRTDAVRAKESRLARRTRSIELPGDVVDALDRLMTRAGDASRAATMARLIMAAADGGADDA